MLSVLLRYTDSDYPFGIFKLFLLCLLFSCYLSLSQCCRVCIGVWGSNYCWTQMIILINYIMERTSLALSVPNESHSTNVSWAHNLISKFLLYFNEMLMSTLWSTNMLNSIFIMLAHWNSTLRVDMSHHSVRLSWLRSISLCCYYFMVRDYLRSNKYQF